MRMNVANHQEKKKNEKTGKRKAGVERRQANLKRLRATLLRSFRGLHGEKMVCVRRVPGVTGTSGRPTDILTQSKRVGDRTTTLRRLLIGTVQFCSLYMYILHIRQKFRTSLSKKIGVNTCFEDGQKVRNDD